MLTLPKLARAVSAPSKLSDVDYVIILMQENRSFDHYFGALAGVRGFDDFNPLHFPSGRSVFYQPDPHNADGYELPFHLDTKRTSAQALYDLSHSWGAEHSSWNLGRMDSWLPAHRTTDGGNATLTMGYYTRDDLPYYYALADAFTICDAYHCSVMGPTHPNRFYLMTGTIDPGGRYGGPAVDNKGKDYAWETYPERLQRAGISWRIYHEDDDFGCNVVKYFGQYQTAGYDERSPLVENALRSRSFESMLADIRSANIPQVTWIVPPSWRTEHPNYMPAAGEDYTAQILAALMSNADVWSRCAFFLMYDENDGLFDHVPPPFPEPGTPGEIVYGLPIGLGFRVPMLVVSPFSAGPWVCGDTFDHTSVLRFLEARFGVEAPYLTQWRRATCGDLTTAFSFGSPGRFEVPGLPFTGEALQIARENVATLPRPSVPAEQVLPHQEPGRRPRRQNGFTFY